MQVLLKKSETNSDIRCGICNQGFRLYWERTSEPERETMRSIISRELLKHHDAEQGNDRTPAAHLFELFNLPEWSGAPQFSGAALLGGLASVHRAVQKPASQME